MDKIARLLADPSASWWIKDALRSALERDPVDSASDALVLAEVLKEHVDKLLHPQAQQSKKNKLI